MNNEESFFLYLCTIFFSSVIFTFLRKNGAVNDNCKLCFDPFKIRIKIALLSAIPVIILPAIQYGVGTDYYMFVDTFYNTRDRMEPLYKCSVAGLRMLSDNPQILFIFMSFLSLYLIWNQISKDSPFPGISVIVFFGLSLYWIAFNEIRYGVAYAITFFSVRYIVRREFIKYLICIVCAMGFHFTAFVFFPSYWIYSCQFRPRVLFLFSTLVVIFRDVLGNLLRQLALMTPYAHYIDGKFDVGEQGYIFCLVSLVVILFGLIFWREDKKYVFYFSMQFIAPLMWIFAQYIPCVHRFRAYYNITTVVFVAMMLHNIKEKKLRYLMAIITCIMFTLYCYFRYERMMTMEWRSLIGGYQTFFGVY